MAAAVAPGSAPASEPEDFVSSLARLLAEQATTLPRMRAVFLLLHLQRAAADTGAPVQETNRLRAALEQAVARARREPSIVRGLRRWLPRGSAGWAPRELREALEAWLRKLPERHLHDLLWTLAVHLPPFRTGRGRDLLVEHAAWAEDAGPELGNDTVVPEPTTAVPTHPLIGSEAWAEDAGPELAWRLRAEVDHLRHELLSRDERLHDEQMRLHEKILEVLATREESELLNARLRAQVHELRDSLEATRSTASEVRDERERLDKHLREQIRELRDSLEATRSTASEVRDERERLDKHLREQIRELRDSLEATRLTVAEVRDERARQAEELERVRAESHPTESQSAEPGPVDPSTVRDLTAPAEDGAGTSAPESVAADDAAAAEPPERHVETGFAREDEPEGWIEGERTLVAGERYWFWLEITDQDLPGSIETEHEPFPGDHLTVGSRLTAELFALPGGLLPDAAASTGELRIAPGGAVRVARQPSPWGAADAARAGEVLEHRLLFPVRAPLEPGPRTMRCSIYHGQTLVQSRLVRAMVTAAPETGAGALTSTLDYTLSRTLRPAYLETIPAHRLSLMVNRNEDGTHGFFFKGEKEFKGTGVIGELEVQAKIDRARKSMRKAAWNSEDDWTSGTPYRYEDGAVDLARLRDDLLGLAVAGLRLYRSTVTELAEGAERAIELQTLMRKPGLVQIVNKISPSFLLPASIFYDYVDLDTGAPLSAVFQLCPAFERALRDKDTPLEQQPCFQGDCPSRREPRHVCPSGFWGFRHELGMPVSVHNGPEAPVTIGVRDAAFGMAVWRGFRQRATHETALHQLARGWGWNYADTRDETIELLHEKRSQIVYFYCHGGFSNDAPYLQVGGDGEGLIHPETLQMGLRWTDPQPLVFINGCETAAVAPEQAFQFVRSLVETHNAAGVIGTEITVFEPLASAFAEAFFDRFLVKQRPLGEAVRSARLTLLKQGNPLGLVYVPFALAGLQLEPAA